jgi:hypothetical protein
MQNINARLYRLFQLTGLGDNPRPANDDLVSVCRWHFQYFLFRANQNELQEPFRMMRRFNPAWAGEEEVKIIKAQKFMGTYVDLEVENLRSSYQLPAESTDALWRRVAFVFHKAVNDLEPDIAPEAGVMRLVAVLREVVDGGGINNLDKYVRQRGYVPVSKDDEPSSWSQKE